MTEETTSKELPERGPQGPPSPGETCEHCTAFCAWGKMTTGMSATGEFLDIGEGGECRLGGPPWPVRPKNDWCLQWGSRGPYEGRATLLERIKSLEDLWELEKAKVPCIECGGVGLRKSDGAITANLWAPTQMFRGPDHPRIVLCPGCKGAGRMRSRHFPLTPESFVKKEDYIAEGLPDPETELVDLREP